MFERFSEPARAAVAEAQREARRLGHAYLGTEHLLLGVLVAADNPGAKALSRLGVGPEDVRRDVIRIIGRGPPSTLDGDDATALRAIGIDLDRIRGLIDGTFGPGALDRSWPIRRRRRRGRCGGGPGAVPFTPRAKRTLQLALREAQASRRGHLGTEDVVLGLASEREGVAAEILRGRGIDYPRLRAAVEDELAAGGDGEADPGPA